MKTPKKNPQGDMPATLAKREVTRTDFERLFGVEVPDDWDATLEFRDDGIWRRVVAENNKLLTIEERAALRGDRQGKLLAFPCTFADLEKFALDEGLLGYVDAFVMARFVAQAQADTDDVPIGREHVSDKLARVIQAAACFWARADRKSNADHPKTADVVLWLEAKGLSNILAKKAATIIRPEWAKLGRKAKE